MVEETEHSTAVMQTHALPSQTPHNDMFMHDTMQAFVSHVGPLPVLDDAECAWCEPLAPPPPAEVVASFPLAQATMAKGNTNFKKRMNPPSSGHRTAFRCAQGRCSLEAGRSSPPAPTSLERLSSETSPSEARSGAACGPITGHHGVENEPPEPPEKLPLPLPLEPNRLLKLPMLAKGKPEGNEPLERPERLPLPPPKPPLALPLPVLPPTPVPTVWLLPVVVVAIWHSCGLTHTHAVPWQTPQSPPMFMQVNVHCCASHEADVDTDEVAFGPLFVDVFVPVGRWSPVELLPPLFPKSPAVPEAQARATTGNRSKRAKRFMTKTSGDDGSTVVGVSGVAAATGPGNLELVRVILTRMRAPHEGKTTR